jgi:hypothetical protein
MTTLKKFNDATGQWEYVLAGPRGIQGEKGDRGETGLGMPANGLGVYDYQAIYNSDFKTGPTGMDSLFPATGSNTVRVSDPEYVGDYYIEANTNNTNTNLWEFTLATAPPMVDTLGGVDSLVFAVDLQNTGPASVSVAPAFLTHNSSKTFLSQKNSPSPRQTLPVGGGWVRYFWQLPVSLLESNAVYLRIRVNVQGAEPGNIIRLRRPKFGVTGTYFNSSSTGAQWNSSKSRWERIGMPQEDTLFGVNGTRTYGSIITPDYYGDFKFSNALYLEGSGSPESVLVAPVGSRYIDTSATNGAVEWIKASGTSSTGWKVSYGDTGWRSLASWTSAGVVTGTMPANATPTAGVAGKFQIRRINDEVTWRMSGMTFGTATTYAMPSGFTATSFYVHRMYVLFLVSNGQPEFNYASIGGGTLYFGQQGRRTDNTYHADINYQTDEAWPSTLPGVAG